MGIKQQIGGKPRRNQSVRPFIPTASTKSVSAPFYPNKAKTSAPKQQPPAKKPAESRQNINTNVGPSPLVQSIIIEQYQIVNMFSSRAANPDLGRINDSKFINWVLMDSRSDGYSDMDRAQFGGLFGYNTDTYIAIETKSYMYVVIRIFRNYRPSKDLDYDQIAKWHRLSRTVGGVAPILDVFVDVFPGDQNTSLFFVHEFIPSAMPALSKLDDTTNIEPFAIFAVSLLSAVSKVHSAKSAFDSLDLTKVLMYHPTNRAVITAAGIMDVISDEELDELQHRDCLAMYHILLSLIYGYPVSSATGTGKPGLHEFVAGLQPLTDDSLSSSQRIERTLQLFFPFFPTIFCSITQECDDFKQTSRQLYVYDRLYRLLTMINVVMHSPNILKHDRLPISLFLYFVFGQSTESGKPASTFGWIYQNLNKLDFGVPQRILLVSPDERQVISASYAELRQQIEHLFQLSKPQV
ncbi:hypothetical protein PCE1_004240 [Barthelona sp. PCE]